MDSIFKLHFVFFPYENEKIYNLIISNKIKRVKFFYIFVDAL